MLHSTRKSRHVLSLSHVVQLQVESTVYGYIGVFLASLLGSATLFFPVPHVATVFAAGMLFNPAGVAIAGGIGGTIGELVGYYVGYMGKSLNQESVWYRRVKDWINRYGGIIIFVLALVPNPFFDLAGIAAGVTVSSMQNVFLTVIMSLRWPC